MTLSQCRLGEIVIERHLLSDHRIGHIVGLTANPEGHVILLVRFACAAKDEAVHQGNLRLLSEIDV